MRPAADHRRCVVGEEDHLEQAIQALGKVEFWRLAIQPGKPLAFGQVPGKPWIGLPGNPTAALITALVVVRRSCCAPRYERVLPVSIDVVAGFELGQAERRRQYLRARLTPASMGNCAPSCTRSKARRCSRPRVGPTAW